MGGSGGGIGSLLKVILSNFDVLAGPGGWSGVSFAQVGSHLASFLVICKTDSNLLVGHATLQWCRMCMSIILGLMSSNEKQLTSGMCHGRRMSLVNLTSNCCRELYKKNTGTQAFEEMIHKAEGERKTHTSNSCFMMATTDTDPCTL
ncbi:hypothetical protein HAX54_019002 [Datura stramonium]|uniref:Uncharacterized protein n=1 Tax=Datura stramonium TaxID=4076 RepID=A0ABS8UNA1_DATST|nr:hypothetical protein [Datura stramonium]